MVCKKCGCQNSQGAVFCNGCGSRLVEFDAKPEKRDGNSKDSRKQYLLVIIILMFIGVGYLSGYFLIHDWTEATCSNSSVCKTCGKMRGEPLGHDWNAATCQIAQTCLRCGLTMGSPSEHSWVEATYDVPKTCRICGITVGDKLRNEPVYINELSYYDKYGKVYYHDEQIVSYENNLDWRDLTTPGHIQQAVRDGYGNTYTYGIHMDGDQLGPYYITYYLDGDYTTFSGWCVLPDYKADTSDTKNYQKYFEVYCDGICVFTTNTMKKGSTSQFFEIDVTGVNVLTIQYPPTTGPNDLAVLCDGQLS